MSSYHQMGHHSENLLHEDDLAAYSGAILSPVDYTQDQIWDQVENRPTSDFEMIFDPQLYFPRTQRKTLPQWRYFPSDFDTSDQTSQGFWEAVCVNLASTAAAIGASAVCTPAVVPRAYSPEYYVLNVHVGEVLRAALEGDAIAVLQSVVVRLADVAQGDHASEIASIISGSKLDQAYVVLNAESSPRRELDQVEELKGAIRLIAHLAGAGIDVTVGFAGTDQILWRAAGASACATGKFFNLRRFTPSRWEPAENGGGQLPYWFEEALFGFLRESDLTRVRDANLISETSLSNPYGIQILKQFESSPGQAWLGLGWRQFMWWFADFDRRVQVGTIEFDEMLESAERTWDELDDRKLLMEERQNDGSWLRSWRRALIEAL